MAFSSKKRGTQKGMQLVLVASKVQWCWLFKLFQVFHILLAFAIPILSFQIFEWGKLWTKNPKSYTTTLATNWIKLYIWLLTSSWPHGYKRLLKLWQSHITPLPWAENLGTQTCHSSLTCVVLFSEVLPLPTPWILHTSPKIFPSILPSKGILFSSETVI